MSFGIKGIQDPEELYENLLKDISEYDIWTHFIGFPIKINKKILSPIRAEKNQLKDAVFFVSQGRILLKDFGGSGKCLNLLAYLRLKYNLTSLEAIRSIQIAFGLSEYVLGEKVALMSSKAVKTGFIPKETKVGIQIKKGPFTKKELEYWESFRISRKTLDLLDIHSLEGYWVIKDEEISYFDKKSDELLFVIICKQQYKIYRPSKKDLRYLGNTTKNTLFNYNNLPQKGDKLYITKGIKEVAQLIELGVNVIGLQSENSFPDEKIINELKQRFKKIYHLFDVDEPGLNASKKFKEKFNTSPIYLPKEECLKENIKDLADYIRIYGYDKGRILLRES